ncbi:cytochrome P450, partial [Oryctes borbonicus]
PFVIKTKMSCAIELIVGLVTLILLFFLYVKYSQSYWKRKGVPYIEPTSIYGNAGNIFLPKRGLMLEFKEFYETFKKRNEKFGGVYIFTEPVFVPVDLDLLKRIMAKDFNHFLGRGFVFNEKHDPLAANLFNTEGEKWKTMRVKLTPTFTSGKMKYMFKTLLDCGDPMVQHINNVSKKGEPLDIKEILACYTTDVIGSCAFGIECNSFKDPDAEFRVYGRKMFAAGVRDTILQFIVVCAPSLIHYLPLSFTHSDVEKFFINSVKSILDYRRSNDVKRNDFMQMFLALQQKAEADGTEPFTLNEIAAQAFIFFLAGFETSSTTMTFCLHELAFNPDIQEKLREEIKEAYKKCNGELTYDVVMEMKYLDQVVNETLRKYPPVPFLNRVCSLDYKIPDTNVTLTKGTKVFISGLGIHRDEEYYPNPDKFDPERFSDENKASIPNFAYIPFGEGPRICIGLRFGMMQTKTGLSMILNNYRLTPGENEVYDMPFNSKSFILTKDGPVMLKAEKISA